MPSPTLILTRGDVASLLTLEACVAVVEQALRSQAEGRTLGRGGGPGVLGIPAIGGGFHIKAAGLALERTYFAAKVNGNFPGNRARFDLPTIQGVIVLADAANGRVLALLDSIEITSLRTGAATAVAAKYLARPDARVATVCGCGVQGRVQLRALTQVRPLDRVYAWDAEPDRAERFAIELGEELRIDVQPVLHLEPAVRDSDICVTCTPARRCFLERDAVRPGTFVAAVGADSEDKQELDPRLLADAALVVDALEQCATIGELHHALAAGLVTRESVHAELHEVVAGRKAGRRSAEEIIVFDSTGTALQDVAAAAAVYERATAQGCGWPVLLGG